MGTAGVRVSTGRLRHIVEDRPVGHPAAHNISLVTDSVALAEGIRQRGKLPIR